MRTTSFAERRTSSLRWHAFRLVFLSLYIFWPAGFFLLESTGNLSLSLSFSLYSFVSLVSPFSIVKKKWIQSYPPSLSIDTHSFLSFLILLLSLIRFNLRCIGHLAVHSFRIRVFNRSVIDNIKKTSLNWIEIKRCCLLSRSCFFD